MHGKSLKDWRQSSGIIRAVFQKVHWHQSGGRKLSDLRKH